MRTVTDARDVENFIYLFIICKRVRRVPDAHVSVHYSDPENGAAVANWLDSLGLVSIESHISWLHNLLPPTYTSQIYTLLVS